MDNKSSTPRITCAYLSQYVGKLVTVVGKVVQLRGEEATIDADGTIHAFLNRVRPDSRLFFFFSIGATKFQE